MVPGGDYFPTSWGRANIIWMRNVGRKQVQQGSKRIPWETSQPFLEEVPYSSGKAIVIRMIRQLVSALALEKAPSCPIKVEQRHSRVNGTRPWYRKHARHFTDDDVMGYNFRKGEPFSIKSSFSYGGKPNWGPWRKKLLCALIEWVQTRPKTSSMMSKKSYYEKFMHFGPKWH